MLGHGVPDTDLAGGRQRDQLSADEEERVDADVEVERSDVDPISGLGEEHGADLLAEGDGDHDGRGFASPAAGGHPEGPHLGVDGHPLDRQVKVWTENEAMNLASKLIQFKEVSAYRAKLLYD